MKVYDMIQLSYSYTHRIASSLSLYKVLHIYFYILLTILLIGSWCGIGFLQYISILKFKLVSRVSPKYLLLTHVWVFGHTMSIEVDRTSFV